MFKPDSTDKLNRTILVVATTIMYFQASTAPTETILERVISLSENGYFSSIVTNLAATSPATLQGAPAGQIDATISNIISNYPVMDNRYDVFAFELVNNHPLVQVGQEDALGLGAVNTGNIFLDKSGDDFAGITAGTNASYIHALTNAVAASEMGNVNRGTSATTSAIVLNMAANSHALKARVDNVIYGVGGTVGDITSTALGAVNNSEIRSGISSIIDSIVLPDA